MSVNSIFSLWRLGAVAVLAGTVVFAGCGFQLRGAAELPPEFDAVALKGVDIYSDLGNSLRTLLEANGSEVVEPDAATSVLWIIDEAFNQDVTG